MKKIISIFLIAVFAINALLPSKSYAENVVTESFSDVANSGLKDFKGVIDTGNVDVNGKKVQATETRSWFSTAVGIAVKVISYIPKAAELLMSVVTSPYTENGVYSSDGINWFTIQDTVFGRIKLFDINIFNTSNSGNANNPNTVIKQQVGNWYYTLRTVAMIASLLFLVYCGIRMAMSTIASDQAKYKQMLIGWVTSLIILFVLPYIFSLVLNFNDTLISLIPQKDASFEQIIETNIVKDAESDSIMKMCGSLLTLLLLTWYHFEFFSKYLMRFLKVAFLIIISPIITVMYAIDKGKRYKKWFQEFIGAVFMQLVHALIYAIFLYSASEIATKAPIITVAFFMALTKGEKIFNYLFNLKGQE